MNESWADYVYLSFVALDSESLLNPSTSLCYAFYDVLLVSMTLVVDR